jgi:hypothetical protein
MATRHHRQLRLPYPYPVVLDAIARVLPPAGFKVNTVDPARGMVFAVRSTSLWSWGENVTIQVGQAGPTQPSEARIDSALVFGLVDWGRNRKNVDKIVEALEGFLAVHAGATRLQG